MGSSAVSIGFSPLYMGASDLPVIWMLPIGYSNPFIPK